MCFILDDYTVYPQVKQQQIEKSSGTIWYVVICVLSCAAIVKGGFFRQGELG